MALRVDFVENINLSPRALYYINGGLKFQDISFGFAKATLRKASILSPEPFIAL